MTVTYVIPEIAQVPSPARTPDPEAVSGDLAVLGARGLRVAPHVAARLHARLHGDRPTILEVSARLTAAQRAGREVLPDPLPLVPAIAERFSTLVLAPWERDVLLAASVCIDTRVDVLLRVAQRSIDDLLAGGLPECLAVAGGSWRWIDPRVRVWVHETASLAERTAIHRRLAHILAGEAAGRHADWHRALSTLDGDPGTAGSLVTAAREAIAQRDGERAFAIAREAAARATGALAPTAHHLAATAALGEGCLDDARAWAAAMSVGSPATARPDVDTLNAAAHALDAGSPAPDGSWPLMPDAVRRALAVAQDGDIGRGLRLLIATDHETSDEPVGARTPLGCAYRGVVSALLHTWAGRLATARDLLLRAAVRYPVAAIFGGLGATLLARLDLARDGDVSPLARSLRDAAPAAPADALVDQALRAHLRGDMDTAAARMTLWHERGAEQGPFALPGLDEVGPVDDRVRREPPDAQQARRLRQIVRTVREGAWVTALREVADECRVIRSGFERARVECLLGTAYAQRGDRAAGARHLRAAESLFDEAGADAWTELARSRLCKIVRLSGEQAPAITIRPADPLAACRAAWEPLLTPRELDVAMLIADGATNREIADRLIVSVRTVEVHAGRLFPKLGVRSRAELTVLAYRSVLYA